MQKIIPVLFLLAMILASCNFPLAESTPDANLVSTKVAETLSAVQTQGVPTLPPPTPVEPPTETPSATLEPSATVTPSATATAPAGDPVLTLGAPGFYDTFSDGTSFGLSSKPYEDEAVLIKVENGAMVFESLRLNNGIRWRLTSRNPQNLYLDGTFRTTSCSGSDQYGLVVRAPTYSDGIGYYFGVTCDGQYYLLRWDEDGQNSLVDLTVEPKILSGSNQVNRLGIRISNNSINLYINGYLVKELSDDGIPGKGYIGAFVSAHEDPGFTVQLEEISLWTLP